MTVGPKTLFENSLARVMRDVKRQVRVLRQQQGLTQRDMADRMGTSQSQYAAWENDTRRLDSMISSVFRAAHALGMRVEIRLVPKD